MGTRTASPAERLSAWEALQHPWFKSRHRDAASAHGSSLMLAKERMASRKKSMYAHARALQPTPD